MSSDRPIQPNSFLPHIETAAESLECWKAIDRLHFEEKEGLEFQRTSPGYVVPLTSTTLAEHFYAEKNRARQFKIDLLCIDSQWRTGYGFNIFEPYGLDAMWDSKKPSEIRIKHVLFNQGQRLSPIVFFSPNNDNERRAVARMPSPSADSSEKECDCECRPAQLEGPPGLFFCAECGVEVPPPFQRKFSDFIGEGEEQEGKIGHEIYLRTVWDDESFLLGRELLRHQYAELVWAGLYQHSKVPTAQPDHDEHLQLGDDLVEGEPFEEAPVELGHHGAVPRANAEALHLVNSPLVEQITTSELPGVLAEVLVQSTSGDQVTANDRGLGEQVAASELPTNYRTFGNDHETLLKEFYFLAPHLDSKYESGGFKKSPLAFRAAKIIAEIQWMMSLEKRREDRIELARKREEEAEKRANRESNSRARDLRRTNLSATRPHLVGETSCRIPFDSGLFAGDLCDFQWLREFRHQRLFLRSIVLAAFHVSGAIERRWGGSGRQELVFENAKLREHHLLLAEEFPDEWWPFHMIAAITFIQRYSKFVLGKDVLFYGTDDVPHGD
jgi:hypothetical protein